MWAICADAVACSATARVVVPAPRRMASVAAVTSRADVACSAVALRTLLASAVVRCAALRMSRAARPCSAMALVTSCEILRIWLVAWATPAAPVACSAVAAAIFLADRRCGDRGRRLLTGDHRSSAARAISLTTRSSPRGR